MEHLDEKPFEHWRANDGVDNEAPKDECLHALANVWEDQHLRGEGDGDSCLRGVCHPDEGELRASEPAPELGEIDEEQ